MKSSQRAPTKEEKQIWSRMASEIGCIACRIDGRFNDYVSIHHVNGRTKPGCHKAVLPLCFLHHQGGNEDAPSVHPFKARFERKYGNQYDLIDMVYDLLSKSMQQ